MDENIELLNVVGIIAVAVVNAIYAEYRARRHGVRATQASDKQLRAERLRTAYAERWRDSVKRYTYEKMNILRASMYDNLSSVVTSRINEGGKTDHVKRQHWDAHVPLKAREAEIRDAIKTVTEEERSHLKSDIYSIKFCEMNQIEIDKWCEEKAADMTKTIRNNIISHAKKSDVIADFFCLVQYGEIHDMVRSVVDHAIRLVDSGETSC